MTDVHRAIFGVKELAELFDVPKNTFRMRIKQEYWGRTLTRFPSPAYVVSATPLWTAEQLDVWIGRCRHSRLLSWRRNKELEAFEGALMLAGQMQITDNGGVK